MPKQRFYCPDCGRKTVVYHYRPDQQSGYNCYCYNDGRRKKRPWREECGFQCFIEGPIPERDRRDLIRLRNANTYDPKVP